MSYLIEQRPHCNLVSLSVSIGCACQLDKLSTPNAGHFSILPNLCSNPKPYIGCQGAMSHLTVSATIPHLPTYCPCSKSQFPLQVNFYPCNPLYPTSSTALGSEHLNFPVAKVIEYRYLEGLTPSPYLTPKKCCTW